MTSRPYVPPAGPVYVEGEEESEADRFPPEVRLEVASKIMSGLVSNPSVIQGNERCGWALVNSSERQLAEYAMTLADQLIMAAHSREPTV